MQTKGPTNKSKSNRTIKWSQAEKKVEKPRRRLRKLRSKLRNWEERWSVQKRLPGEILQKSCSVSLQLQENSNSYYFCKIFQTLFLFQITSGGLSEAAVCRYSTKEVSWKISQNSQENIFAGVLLIKLKYLMINCYMI